MELRGCRFDVFDVFKHLTNLFGGFLNAELMFSFSTWRYHDKRRLILRQLQRTPLGFHNDNYGRNHGGLFRSALVAPPR